MCLIANRIINKRKGKKQKLKQYIRLIDDVAELIKYYYSMTYRSKLTVFDHTLPSPFSYNILNIVLLTRNVNIVIY